MSGLAPNWVRLSNLEPILTSLIQQLPQFSCPKCCLTKLLFWLIPPQNQNVVYLVHLDGQAYQEWLALFGSAFALKFLSLCHMICVQCWTDIFLVDWERPKGQQVTTVGEAGGKSKKLGNNVSIWRTYFVANEWNEIQVGFCSAKLLIKST